MMNGHHRSITRRDFARETVGAALGLSLLGATGLRASQAGARSSLVAIVRDEKAMDAARRVDLVVLQKMLDQTLLQVTGKKSIKEAWRSLVKAEDYVGLVPTPHLNPTHDELTGLVRKALVEIVGVPENKVVIAQGRSGAEQVKPCTALISLPGLKAHWLTGIGTVLKNYIMYSGRPSRYHDENNAQLGEIWLKPEVKGKTRLVLVDALYPLCDKGPQPDPRYKWEYKGLLAGIDPVAVEAICLKIIMEKRQALKGEPWPLSPPPLCLEAADKVYGLGTSKLEEIKIETSGWGKDLLLG